MKKIASLILVALMTTFILDVSAQNAGIKFGSVWSRANLKADEGVELPDQKFLISPQVGVIFETTLYEGLILQTGLMASLNGYRYEGIRPVADENGDSVYVTSTERPILIYISLPVNIGYKHMTSDKFGIFGMVGPVFRYLAYSTWSYKASGEWDNEATNIEMEDGEEKSIFNTFDFAINIEAGVQYDRFKFSLYYAPSFTNIYSDDLLNLSPDSQWKNYSFGVNVAVLFGPIE